MIKEFKILNKISRDHLFQSKQFENWIKGNLGYPYYNNEFSELQFNNELCNPSSSSKLLVNTEIYDKIILDPSNFYKEVLSEFEISSLVMVNNGGTLFIGENTDNTTLLCTDAKDPTCRKIIYATGAFQELMSEPNKYLELYNKFVEQSWETRYGVLIIQNE